MKKKLEGIMKTRQGMERNMYYYLKKLFVEDLCYQDREVQTDVADLKSGKRARPDVQVNVEGHVPLHGWIIVEAKDERGIFRNQNERESIIREKIKYLTSDTRWFVLVDPETWYMREYTPNQKDYHEVLLYLHDPDFMEKIIRLRRDEACKLEYLQLFRDCYEDWIASIDVNDNMERFYGDLRKGFNLLVDGCKGVLAEIDEEYFIPLRKSILEFSNRFEGELRFTFKPFTIEAPQPRSLEETWEFRNWLKYFRKMYNLSPNTFMLAYQMLPVEEYIDPDRISHSDKKDVLERISLKTASLIVSRVLMLRFFEDHSFFGDYKYLCNGGIKAFNYMRQYFDSLYPSLIQRACKEGAKFYDAIFMETEYDWIFDNPSEIISLYVEQLLYYMSFYDFTTVREDILNEIYQRVVDPKLRKKLGQIYTRPQVARYLVERCYNYLEPEKVLDPACGTGTFLVECYEKKFGESARKGVLEYNDICEQIDSICGNDINAVAASISQMQLIWRLLPYTDSIKEQGFPEVEVTTGDALRERNLYSIIDEWDEIDSDIYDLVIGNPPYIRHERFSGRKNIYLSFVYKALSGWLRPGGVMGFVLPLSILDSKEGSYLRQLFSQRYRIMEIVNLEEVAEEVFPEVTINTILLIVQNKGIEPGDTVTLRTARNYIFQEGNFDFSQCDVAEVDYSAIFAPSGNIAVRITTERKAIADKIGGHKTFQDIARRYWVKKSGNTIIEASLEQQSGWEPVVMIRRGAVARRKREFDMESGLSTYKGEHVQSCRLIDEPIEQGLIPKSLDDPSFWKYPAILPEYMYAFQRISISPTACVFKPSEKLFYDTVTLFAPQAELESVPFDFLVLSSIYRWYFAVWLREGVVSKYWSNVYPSTVRQLPWSDDIVNHAEKLQELKQQYLGSCKQLNEVLLQQLYEIEGLENLKNRILRVPGLKISWVDSEEKEYDEWYRYWFSLVDYFEVNDAKTYELLEKIIPMLGIESTDKKDELLAIPLPVDKTAEQKWYAVVEGKAKQEAEKSKDEALIMLDEIVANSFGLNDTEKGFIYRDISEDSLFNKLKPEEPYTPHTIRGLWSKLDSSERYR